ncbi:hypothetical protein G9A89_018608 [Geosiphon pyriformis]|nr:hypothetical protein G9A89_018608 [Geosiphon pyriformis]
MDKTKQLFDTKILQQLEYFVGKNNLSIQAQAIYQIHTAFQDQSEILLNKAMDMVTKLQTQITQVILENEIQEILQEEELTELDFNRAQY